MLDKRVVERLRATQERLDAEGQLRFGTQLAAYYDTFRRRFGPEQLSGLDGEVLLETIHDHDTRDSLVYWLEFKNDDVAV